ncbi:MAG: copper resistance protein B [Woeseia sp.]
MRRLQALLLLTWLLVAPQASADERAGTPDDWPPPMHDPGPFWMVQGDRFESTLGESGNHYSWDLQGWYGYDRRRLRFKSEGEGEWGERSDDAELQLLYSQLVAPYWEWQLGIRHDFRPADGRSFAVAGLQGMAPYLFEIDAAFFLSQDGDLSARFEAEYDLLITQKLILQPRFEADLAFSDVAALGIRGGDFGTGLGLRLRYELRREIAPYLGFSLERRRDALGTRTDNAFIAGLHFWF